MKIINILLNLSIVIAIILVIIMVYCAFNESNEIIERDKLFKEEWHRTTQEENLTIYISNLSSLRKYCRAYFSDIILYHIDNLKNGIWDMNHSKESLGEDICHKKENYIFKKDVKTKKGNRLDILFYISSPLFLIDITCWMGLHTIQREKEISDIYERK